MKQIETRKIIALFAALILGFCLIYAVLKGDRETMMAIIPIYSGAIGWYFAKSTALDMPKKEE